MAWIESHSVLIDHRKVRECALILGIKKVYLIGHLHCLWHKVIELAEDGVITDWTDEDIAYYAQWDGDAKKFVEALTGRFIDVKKHKKVVHDWLDYAWKYLYRKYHTANPNRLKTIEEIHKTVGKPKSKTKGDIKGDSQVVLPNQPNQPNQPKEEFILPEFIDLEIWNSFLEMRKKMKKPPTGKAKELLIEDLIKFKEAGEDVNEVLKQSIKNSWQGVFEVKKRTQPTNAKGGSLADKYPAL